MNRRILQKQAPVLHNIQVVLGGDYANGNLLLLATLGAMLLANGPLSGPYHDLLEYHLTLRVGPLEFAEIVQEWINKTLMAIFFLSVGLEIKQELLLGSLRSVRKAALPVAGTIGGMLVPALIFVLFNRHPPGIVGWAIPMATDPAFAIAILTVLGNRIPSGLRAFLVTLAVVDDIGATIVIALVYHEVFLLPPLLISLAVIVLLLSINKAGVQNLLPYLCFGMVLWAAFLKSGIHTSVAGVILALTIPAGSNPMHDSLALRLEHTLKPWVNYLILPVFALANAGITFQEIPPSAIFSAPVVIGVFLGLLIGKPLGIVIACSVAVYLGTAHLPEGVRWKHIIGAGFLGGIGFTTSIFLANLAFAGDRLFDYSKIGILTASLGAAVLGWLILIVISSSGKNERYQSE